MSTVVIKNQALSVHLTVGEKIAGLRRDLEVPLSAVTAVEVVPDALAAVRGLRAPGLGLPRIRKIGTWRTKNGAEFVVASAGQPAVRVHLRGQKLNSLLVGAQDAHELARTIKAAR